MTAGDTYSSLLASEGAWLRSRQRSTGAISSLNLDSIDPYFGHQAALGMVHDSDSHEAIRNWLTWYFSKMNLPDADDLFGTVYRFTVVGGVEVEGTDADADDSPAALLLTLAKALFVHGDSTSKDFIRDNQRYFELAAGVLSRLMNAGLTIAKPAYPIKFLMDNVEVWRGFKDAAWLSTYVWKTPVGAAYYEAKAVEIAAAIEANLWTGTAYRTSLGAPAPTLTTFYPDVLAQVWPITQGYLAPDSPRAIALWNTFQTNFPNWELLGTGDAFPHASLSFVAVLMGARHEFNTYVEQVRVTHLDAAHVYPWFTSESGWLMRALALYK